MKKLLENGLNPEIADVLLVKIPEKIMVTNIHITNTILYGRINLMNNLFAYIRIDLRLLLNETLNMSFLMDKEARNVLKYKSNRNTDIYDDGNGNYIITNNSLQTQLKKITPIDFKEVIPELNCMQPVTTIKCDQIAKVIGKNDPVLLGVIGGKIEFVELQKTSHTIILSLDDTKPLKKIADQKVKSYFFLKIKYHEMTVTLCKSKRDRQYWLKTTFQMTEQVEIECFEPVLEVK